MRLLGTRMKTKVVVANLLFLVFGLPVGTHVQAQPPPAKQPGNAQHAAEPAPKPNAAAAQTAVAAQTAMSDAAPAVVRLLPQNLPQDPLRVAIHAAVQRGMQEAKLNRAATPAAQGAKPGNAAQITAQNAAPNAASNIGSQTSTQQNTSPGAAQNGLPAVNTAPNPSQLAASPTDGSIPPAINAGIQAMVSAKASLENSGNKWGGHKQKAIRLIDQALQACGRTSTPDAGATTPNPAGDTPAMQAALAQLTAAQNHFKNAKSPWGGRRDQAIPLVSQALSEVQAAIDFAKSHNTL
jgi:hypothetical protein